MSNNYKTSLESALFSYMLEVYEGMSGGGLPAT